MITRKQIEAYVRTIVETFHPHKVILFGSYAYGEPTEDSDVDLMVVLPFEINPIRMAGRILTQCPAPFDAGLLSRTPEQIADRIQKKDAFIQELVTQGQVLYDRNQ